MHSSYHTHGNPHSPDIQVYTHNVHKVVAMITAKDKAKPHPNN